MESLRTLDSPRVFSLRADPRLRAPALGVLAALALGVFSGPAEAGLRMRELDRSGDAIEAALRGRAAASNAERVHAILEAAPSERARLERAGVSFQLSIDGDLWLASLPAAPVRAGSAFGPHVRAWDLRPSDRVAPHLHSLAARDPGGLLRVRVKFFRDADVALVRRTLDAAGAHVLRAAPELGVWDAAVRESSLAALANADAVRWIEPSPPPPEEANNGMRADAEVTGPQSLGYGGVGILLGMWDSGTPDAAHPDLAGRIAAGQGGLSTTLHPTHVAGIAIGDGTNSAAQGAAPLQWRGVATRASIVVYDAVGALAEVDSAIQSYDIDLATNSWVYPVNASNCAQYGDYGADAPEFDAIVRGLYGKKLPVVFAAGNERDDGDCAPATPGGYFSLPPPGTAKNVISVGAHLSDVLFMTPFSSWGPTDDGRMKPDVSAPGCQQGGDFGITSTSPGGAYLSVCGTSMSAPVVSGAIAILLEEWRSRYPADPFPSTSKALLGGFAKDRANPGPDYRFGLGAIRLDRSLHELRSATTIEDQVGHGALDSWTFLVAPGTDTLAVTIAWDDPPGAELADTTLVNDLDLTLESPAAVVHLPFVLDPANPSANATTGVNRLDNVEQVRVLAPQPGLWTARVAGTHVPDGPQEYSLVGFDSRPPADPAGFAAQATSDTTIALTWTRPGDPDRAGTLLVRSTSAIAWSPLPGVSYAAGTEPAPGVFVVFASDADHAGTPFRDEPLAPGTTFHYAAFAFDEIPNASPGVHAFATTTSNAVGAPALAASSPSRPRVVLEGANPVRDAARLRFELPRAMRFSLAILDVRGARVAELRRGVLDAGSHVVPWDGRTPAGAAVPSGVYFARLETSEGISVAKLLVVR